MYSLSTIAFNQFDVDKVGHMVNFVYLTHLKFENMHTSGIFNVTLLLIHVQCVIKANIQHGKEILF